MAKITVSFDHGMVKRTGYFDHEVQNLEYVFLLIIILFLKKYFRIHFMLLHLPWIGRILKVFFKKRIAYNEKRN